MTPQLRNRILGYEVRLSGERYVILSTSVARGMLFGMYVG